MSFYACILYNLPLKVFDHSQLTLTRSCEEIVSRICYGMYIVFYRGFEWKTLYYVELVALQAVQCICGFIYTIRNIYVTTNIFTDDIS